jgi:hypothetical protein
VEAQQERAVLGRARTLNLANTPAGGWSFLAAGLLVLFYFWASVHTAAGRFIWYDETRTVLVARLPDTATIWTALKHSIEVLPPPYYMVVRFFDKFWPDPLVAIRLPSALGFAAGLFIVFDCARRMTNGLHGLIAIAVLTCSFLPFYGYEARPYALYFMVAASSFWVWTTTRDNKSSAVLFGVTIFLGIMVHYCGVLSMVPYAVWEIVDWRPWRRPSRKIIAGTLGLFAATALLFTHIEALRALSPHVPFRPSLWDLRKAFSEFFPNGLFLLGLIMVWVALTGSMQKTISLLPMPSGERLGWLFFSIPLACFFVPLLGTNSLQTRYLIGVLPGVAVAFSCCLWRHFRDSWPVPAGILVLLGSWGIAERIPAIRHQEPLDGSLSQSRIQNLLNIEASVRKDGKQYFVLDRIGLFLEARLNSSHPTQYVFLDTPLHREAVTRSMASRLAVYSPMLSWDLKDLQKHAGEAALIGPNPEILDALKNAGAKFEIGVVAHPENVFYFQ